MSDSVMNLKAFLAAHNVQAEVYEFTTSTHSVAEAALAVGAAPDDFIKNICLLDPSGRLILAIVKGEDRVDRSRVSQTLGISTSRLATPDEILKYTG